MLDAAQWIALVVIVTGLAQIAFYIVQLAFAAIALSNRPPVPRGATLWRRYSDQAPPIAVIAPAYNEELTVVESVRSLLALHYPNFEVLLVNDGSKDRTLARVIEEFGLKQVGRFIDGSVKHQPIRGFYPFALVNSVHLSGRGLQLTMDIAQCANIITRLADNELILDRTADSVTILLPIFFRAAEVITLWFRLKSALRRRTGF